MNIRDRIMAALHREKPDRIPWVIYAGLSLHAGALERRLRNKGLGLRVTSTVCTVERPNVRVEERREGNILHRTYRTPVGSVSTKHRTGLPTGTGGSWCMEHMIKDVADYDVVKFMVEDTVYTPDYEPFLNAEHDLGGDGVVAVGTGATPLLAALKNYMGYRRFAVDLYRHPTEFNDLIGVLDRDQEKLYRIVAESPAEVVWCGENLNGVIISPRLFEKHCLPAYAKYAGVVHAKGKLYMVHMDGRLRCLKDLIRRADVDVVEAFTPPPMGDLSLEEARAAWGDKFALWLNFPATVYYYGASEVEKHVIGLLREAAPGEGFIMGVTEDIPPNLVEMGLRTITETMAKYGRNPTPLH